MNGNKKTLLEMAEQFDGGTDPLLATDWLREHHMTLEETMSMSSLIATLLRAYAESPEAIQTAMLAAGSTEGKVPVDQVWAIQIQKYLSTKLYAV